MLFQKNEIVIVCYIVYLLVLSKNKFEITKFKTHLDGKFV